MKVLMQNGAEIEAKDMNGATALHVAAECGHQNATEYLLNSGADGTSLDHKCWMPLHCASFRGHLKIVKLLIRKYPAMINAPMPEWQWLQTPLHLAVAQNRIECIEALLQSDAGLETRTKDRCTPLYIAAHEGQAKALECLLKHGANAAATNVNGKRPLQVAWQKRLAANGGNEKGYNDVIKVLTAAEGEICVREATLLKISKDIDGRIDKEQLQLGRSLSSGLTASDSVQFALWRLQFTKVCSLSNVPIYR